MTITPPSGVCRLAPVVAGRADWNAGRTLTVASPLSRRQRQILDFIRAFIDSAGYPPTLREIGEGVALRSKSSVAYQVGQLVDRGLVELPGDRGHNRALKLGGVA